MRVQAWTIPLALLLASGGTVSGTQTPGEVTLKRGDTWIRDVTLVSPERQTPLPHAHVVVRDGRIATVETSAPRPGASGITIVSGAGKYLVPGLIDGHVHLAGVPGMTPKHEAAIPSIVEAYYRQLPRSYLYFGVTAVVDLNVVDRRPVERMRATDVAPAVFDCGNALSLANGYPMAYLPLSQRFELYPNFLYDPHQRDSIPEKFTPEQHSPDAAVGRVAASGGRCVKAFYESGFGSLAGKLPVPTPELMQAVRDASHRRGLPLLLHANSIEAHRFAANVGPDVVVHGLWNWERAATGNELTDPVRDVLAAERKSGIAMMPTSRVIGGLADLFNPAFLADPHLARVLPAPLLAWYRSEDAQWFARETLAGFSGLAPERARAILLGIQDRGTRAAAQFASDGGRILLGTDTPSAPTYANPPGYNGYLELRQLEAAGLTPRQLLAAGTLENAKVFGLAADYGTIEPGKIASLVLLSADPMASTSAFDTIETVIVKGRVVARSALAAGSR